MGVGLGILDGQPRAPFDVGAEYRAKLGVVRQAGLAGRRGQQFDPPGPVSLVDVLAEVLREQGLDVREADHGAAGLRILRSPVAIDLVVTDIGLPGGMNGRQMIEASRPLRPDLRVLYVTGYAESAVVGEGLLTPNDQLLTKPFALDAFAGCVGAMTGRR